MNSVRVTPWKEGDPAPDDLLAAMRQRRPDSELIGIDRVLLKSFPLATGWNALLGRVRSEFSLPLEMLELIMLRVAVLNKAEFEWGVHYPAYLKAGGTEEKAQALRSTNCNDAVFDVSECALISLTDQSTLSVEVKEETINEIKLHFGEEQTVEAVATVAAYNMVSRFLVALKI